MRRCQVFKDEIWKDILFSDVKKGNKFRLFESSGDVVVVKISDGKIKTEWTAVSDARPSTVDNSYSIEYR